MDGWMDGWMHMLICIWMYVDMVGSAHVQDLM